MSPKTTTSARSPLKGHHTVISDKAFGSLTRVRLEQPEAIAAAASERHRTSVAEVATAGDLFLVAADHPARAALSVGKDRLAMANRRSLLERLAIALEHPRVDGVLASADVIEDLLLLGLLDDKLVIGSMNRGGLAGSVWELDDRFTGYDAPHIDAMGFDGGKMLLRIDRNDRDTRTTLEAASRAVTDLADRSLMAMIEPLPAHRSSEGAVTITSDPNDLIHAIAVASGIGATSAHTWLKLPVVADIERVIETTTLPCLLLGGDIGPDPDATYAGWQRALLIPQVHGLVAGRALLYPGDGDVNTAVDRATRLLEGGRHD
jgi:hypothetical protein